MTGLLSGLSDTLTGTQVDFILDSDGRLTEINRSNGVDTIYTWDGANNVIRIQHGRRAAGFIDIQHDFNPAGQVIQEIINAPLDPPDFLIPGTQTFPYDAASQINLPGFIYTQNGNVATKPGIYPVEWGHPANKIEQHKVFI